MQIQSTLKTIGYDPEIIQRASICAYESEMNIVMHGGDGTIYLTVDDSGIVIEASDNGVGIEDIDFVTVFGVDRIRVVVTDEDSAVGARARPELELQQEIRELTLSDEEGARITVRLDVVVDDVPLRVADLIETRQIVAGEKNHPFGIANILSQKRKKLPLHRYNLPPSKNIIIWKQWKSLKPCCWNNSCLFIIKTN